MRFSNTLLSATAFVSYTIADGGHGDDSADHHDAPYNWHAPQNSKYKHVALFSVDGLHGSDVPKYVKTNPNGNIATLLKTGYEYQSAFTSAPSDSFPGTVNFIAGASPRTSGVWYDDTFDGAFYEPFSSSGSNCSGPAGAEVVYDESIDYNGTLLFSGGIKPANLPQSIVNGKCINVYPHQRIRVNTIFEVVHQAGKQTVYADKHVRYLKVPAYDLVRGPSGKGLSIGYFPEIASIGPTVEDTIAYDQLHVTAFLDWIAGTTPDNSEVQDKLTGPPTLLGGNFQSVSVAQKTSGYQAKSLDFTPELKKALDFVDDSFGKIISALKQHGIYDQTLIIVASKHGQAAIDPTMYGKVDPKLVTAATGVKVAFQTSDDIALIFLDNAADTDAAVAGLNAQRAALRIQDIIYGPQLIARGFGNPATDTAVPNIIVVPVQGIIYTTSTKKIAEHGGLSVDDRHVACFLSNPALKETKFSCEVSTRQVAPTVLKALGYDPEALQGVQIEGTEVLDGF